MPCSQRLRIPYVVTCEIVCSGSALCRLSNKCIKSLFSSSALSEVWRKMVQQLCLWKWFTVGTALAAVLARALAQNDEGKSLPDGVELWEGWDASGISLEMLFSPPRITTWKRSLVGKKITRKKGLGVFCFMASASTGDCVFWSCWFTRRDKICNNWDYSVLGLSITIGFVLFIVQD